MRYPQGGLTADERADREQVRQATADWLPEGATDREVAARFRVTGCRPTAGATRWPPAVARHWRRREPVGAHCQLSPAQLDELQVRLDAAPAAEGWADQCWTLARIAALVRTRFGVNYTLPGLDLLLHRMGWSVQVPARRAADRDEEQITAWREETWPEIKERRRTWAPGWSSRTSPVTGLQAAEGSYLGPAGSHSGGAGDRGQQSAAVAGRAGGH